MRFLAFVGGTLLLCTISKAQTFVRVADTSTVAPNGTGVFSSFDAPSSNREALPDDPIEIFFRGVTDAGVKGIYFGSGQFAVPHFQHVTRLADTTLPMPGFAENFGDFISYSGPYWIAVGAGGINMAIYNNSYDISSNPVTKTGTSINSFGVVSWGNGTGNFQATYGANGHIFNIGGTQIAADGMAPSLARNDYVTVPTVVSYRNAANTQLSEYVLPVGSQTSTTRTVASFSTPIPGGTGNFTGFGDATATTKYVIFRGLGVNQQQGIYRSTTAGVLTRIADVATIAPSGMGAHFSSFEDPSPGDEFSSYDAFVATLSDGREGIYLASGSALAKLVDTTDLLDGKSIQHLYLSRDAIEDHNVAFKATFTDGSQAIYAVQTPFTVPEPATIAGISLLAACARQRGDGVRRA